MKNLMRMLLMVASLTVTTATLTKMPNWFGKKISNKTEHPLKISVLWTEDCDDKNDTSCKHASGYVLLLSPNKSILNKKTNMSYDIDNRKHMNAIIVEVQHDKGQTTVPSQRIDNPRAKNYKISMKNNMLSVK